MSDHYHYEYAEARHDHRGDYADSRHDHDIDYAEKHHRHYDLETDDATTRQGIADLRAEVAELREDLRDAFARIHALEQQAPDARQAEAEADLAMVGRDQDGEAVNTGQRGPRLRRLRPQCDCPEKDGMTWHQRATCTDPDVARLNWYASDEGGQS